MTATTDRAEELHTELTDKLGEAAEALGEAVETAGKLKDCFKGDPDYVSEYQQASRWEMRIVYNPLPDLLNEVSGDEEPSRDSDSAIQFVTDRGKLVFMKRLLEFASRLDSSDFPQSECDELATDIELALQ